MRTLFGMAACALLTASGAMAQTSTRTTTATAGDTTITARTPAFGPSGLLLGAEGELAIPVGNFSDIAGIGIGGYLTGDYKLQPNLNLTGRAGLQLHLPKSYPGDVSFWAQLVPVLVGAKYFVQGADQQGLFVVGETGVSLALQHAGVAGFGSSTELDLWLDLGAGVGYQLGALSFKAMLSSVNIAHFGDALQLTLGAGMQFKGI